MKYQQPHNIHYPEVELMGDRVYKFKEVQHGRQKYEAKRMYKDRRER